MYRKSAAAALIFSWLLLSAAIGLAHHSVAANFDASKPMDVVGKVKEVGGSLLKRLDWMKMARRGAGLAFTLSTGLPSPDQITTVLPGQGSDVGRVQGHRLVPWLGPHGARLGNRTFPLAYNAPRRHSRRARAGLTPADRRRPGRYTRGALV